MNPAQIYLLGEHFPDELNNWGVEAANEILAPVLSERDLIRDKNADFEK